MSQPFIHLHVRTEYSVADGACRIGPLCARAAELGMTALAITDYGVMYGVFEFVKACRMHGIRPVIGCEFRVSVDAQAAGCDAGAPCHDLVLLAETDEGYRNLIRLATLAHSVGSPRDPRIDKAMLRRNARGLIGLSAGLRGEVGRLLAEGDVGGAKRAAEDYADILGKDGFFLEMQVHGMPEQRSVNVGVRELCRLTGLRPVATNDVRYLLQVHAGAHAVLAAGQTGVASDDSGPAGCQESQRYLKSGEEMVRQFPDDAAALETTVAIAARCTASVVTGATHFPRSCADGPHELRRRLRRTAYEGLGRLYGIKDPGQPANPFERALAHRLADELTVIEHAGAAEAFLAVSDLVAHARAQGIPVGPGRGGAAGSLAAYVLAITGVDPVRFNLVSELFLNPARASPPHFELDLCQARCGEVIRYLASRYGPERVARTAIFSRFTAKSAIRVVARALGVPQSKAACLAATVPDSEGACPMTFAEARVSSVAFAAACSADADMRRIAPIAEAITGLCRHVGIHAAAFAIGDKPLADLVPLTYDTAGNAVTQYAKADVEACGLLTMNLLGLGPLTALANAVGLVQRRRNVAIDLAQLPLDDPETCRLLSCGNTADVFQADSDGVRELMRAGGVGGIEDLVAILTLYRPAAMAMIPIYLARKQGREPPDCDHPLLEPVLRETYGLILDQEQILHAVHALAGYPLGEADLLRRAMVGKASEAMGGERARFAEGCARVSRIPADRAESIFDRIAASAGSAFCKAHAVAYGIITYQAAYMKAHYPEEFLYAQRTCEERCGGIAPQGGPAASRAAGARECP